MMGWLITLGILVLLAVLPLGVSVRYNADGPLIKIIVCLLQLQVVPARKKADQNEKKVKSKNRDQSKEKASKQTSQKTKANHVDDSISKPGGSITDFMPLVELAFDFLGAFTRKLRVKRLFLNVVLAGDDPCDLAINYGKAWTALGNLWPRLEEIFVIQKRDVQVQCDFEATDTRVTAHVDITVTLGRLLSVIVCYGIRALTQYMKITNKRKGGAAI